MIQAQNVKKAQLIRPGAIVNNTSWTSQNVDTLGFTYATLCFQLGALDAAITALKVQHSEDGSTNWGDISGADFSASTLPSATDDNGFFSVYVNLHNKRRYLRCVATIANGATGGYLSAHCDLSGATICPSSASERGNTGELLVS